MKKNSKSVNLIFLDEKSEIINSAIDFVSEFFKNDSSGHDFSHTMRVYKGNTFTGAGKQDNQSRAGSQSLSALY